MKVCTKCLTLSGPEQLYCPKCKTILSSSQNPEVQKMTTFKNGRLRTLPSKVYHYN